MSLEKLQEAVIDGDCEAAVALTRRALESGIDPQEILDQALTVGMRVVGDLFEEGEFFVPEMLVAAEAMAAATEVLKPLLASEATARKGKVVLGTVEGDLHDIGKRLVGMMLEGTGFEIIDLGTSVSAAEFARVAQESNADLVGLSALLTTTLPAMEEAIRLCRDLDGGHTPKIMVGGAPVTQDFADRVGADGYAPDAASAANLARELLAGPA